MGLITSGKSSRYKRNIGVKGTELTEFFCRFEGFDEPWKVRFNTKEENWEDKWGLMNVNRELKAGLKIPDCGGKRVP